MIISKIPHQNFVGSDDEWIEDNIQMQIMQSLALKRFKQVTLVRENWEFMTQSTHWQIAQIYVIEELDDIVYRLHHIPLGCVVGAGGSALQFKLDNIDIIVTARISMDGHRTVFESNTKNKVWIVIGTN